MRLMLSKAGMLQEEVKQILLGLQINTEVIDRFVVRQNIQAVGVKDPMSLAQHLEVLGGTAGFVDMIKAKQHDIHTSNEQCNDLTEETDR